MAIHRYPTRATEMLISTVVYGKYMANLAFSVLDHADLNSSIRPDQVDSPDLKMQPEGGIKMPHQSLIHRMAGRPVD